MTFLQALRAGVMDPLTAVAVDIHLSTRPGGVWVHGGFLELMTHTSRYKLPPDVDAARHLKEE